MKLYSYFRSSASFRVRIALALKGLDYDYVPVHLLKGGGQQFAADFKALNPAALVPVLQEDDGRVLTQSLAIIEYLDETRPLPPLLPPDPADRARVRGIALAIACEIHPLNNLRVLGYLNKTLGLAEEQRNTWYRHWVETGLATVESLLATDVRTGRCCHGDMPTLADICLVPQIFNAQRFNARLEHVPTVMRIHAHCLTLPAFAGAVPAQQPDAE
jgi:maleylacetoacetate isomerase